MFVKFYIFNITEQYSRSKDSKRSMKKELLYRKEEDGNRKSRGSVLLYPFHLGNLPPTPLG